MCFLNSVVSCVFLDSIILLFLEFYYSFVSCELKLLLPAAAIRNSKKKRHNSVERV